MSKKIQTPEFNKSPGPEKVIFVYGSLKRGHSNHARILSMGGATLGETETEAGFKLFYYEPYRGRGIATMVRSQSGGTVRGELVYVPNIEVLHKFEGHPHYYKLEPLVVESDQGILISTFAYIFQHPKDLHAKVATEIIDGDYREEDWHGPDF